MNQFKLKGFIVWGICALFFLYEFFLRIVIGTYQQPLMLELSLTSFEFAILSTTTFSLIYGIMQIPVGLIVENIGLKKSLLIGSLCCSLATIGFSYADSYPVALLFRILMGFGASFGFVCLLISVYDWMPHKYGAIFIGLSQFIGTLGPMLATGPLDSLSYTNNIHWRFVFLFSGILGIFIGLLILFFVENNRGKMENSHVPHRLGRSLKSLSILFTKIQPWFIAILSACLYFSIEYLSENEGRSFLILKGVSSYHASYMMTIAWIGYALGCPILGLLSDFLERRKMILTLSAFLGLFSIVCILYLSDLKLLQVSFFVLGISAGGQSVGFAMMAEQFKKKFIAIGFALNNTMITIVCALNAPMIGLLLDSVKSTPSLILSDYLIVFNILVILAAIALLISIFAIKETYCKSLDH